MIVSRATQPSYLHHLHPDQTNREDTVTFYVTPNPFSLKQNMLKPNNSSLHATKVFSRPLYLCSFPLGERLKLTQLTLGVKPVHYTELTHFIGFLSIRFLGFKLGNVSIMPNGAKQYTVKIIRPSKSASQSLQIDVN